MFHLIQGNSPGAPYINTAEEDEVAEGRDQFYSYIEEIQNKAVKVVKTVGPYSSGG